MQCMTYYAAILFSNTYSFGMQLYYPTKMCNVGFAVCLYGFQVLVQTVSDVFDKITNILPGMMDRQRSSSPEDSNGQTSPKVKGQKVIDFRTWKDKHQLFVATGYQHHGKVRIFSSDQTYIVRNENTRIIPVLSQLDCPVKQDLFSICLQNSTRYN